MQEGGSSERLETVNFAFDPKAPSVLIYPSGDDGNGFNIFSADSGIGCNAEETSALMKILKARDECFSHAKDTGSLVDVKTLSKAYRRELVECMRQWDSRIQEEIAMADDGNAQRRKSEETDLELLRISHTIAHLCEIYLLNHESVHMSMPSARYQSTKGVVTSDTIRYLRFNHFIDPFDIVASVLGDDMDIDKLLDLNQPEYYDPLSDGSMAIGGSGQMTPYWLLVRKLVLQGNLNEAWAVICRHSSNRRSQLLMTSDDDRYHADQTVLEDAEAFALIRALLLAAPIPGGRSTVDDDGLAIFREDEENESDEIDPEEFITGIPQNGYKLWDVTSNEMEFNIHPILNLHTMWKNCVADSLRSNQALRNLTRRIPMLSPCLWDIILKTKNSYLDEDSWAERLAAELIYARPDTCKDDMHIRAIDHREQCASNVMVDENATIVEDILVSILSGDAGAVINSLNLSGGGSGAALPATMSALQCSLLVDSGSIVLTNLSFDVETELVLSASSAILSSFAMQGNEDFGVRQCIRLLSPYIAPENNRVTAYVADVLCRHWPKSDTELMSLLESCRDAVSAGSRRMLEACDSLCFSRSLYYERKGNTEKSAYFLLRGIEQSSLFGSEAKDMKSPGVFTKTTCFRRLTSLCTDTVEVILTHISQCFAAEEVDVTILTNPLQVTKGIMEVLSNDDIYQLISSDISVLLLKHIVDVCLNLVMTNKSDVANALVECLRDRLSTDGSVIILAPPGLYGYLLTIAYDILQFEASQGLTQKTSAFDLKGIQTLLCRFTQYCSKDEFYISKASSSSMRSDISLDKMRLALGKGLMRAFVTENAKLARDEFDSSADFDTNELSEVSVEQLLGPSMD